MALKQRQADSHCGSEQESNATLNKPDDLHLAVASRLLTIVKCKLLIDVRKCLLPP